MRDTHYKQFNQRLSDKNLDWLKKEREKHKSWNILFDELINNYKKNGEKRNKI